jgi:hypothetical protein
MRADGEVEMECRSFWISGLDWDESEVLNICQHLNFYIRYCDPTAPIVIFHEPEEVPIPTTTTALFDTFPTVLSGRQLDPFLLKLWESTVGADPFRKYLHYYQILEYASFYFLKDDAVLKIKKILAAPDLPCRSAEAARAILEMSAETQMSDEQKLVQVVQRFAEPANVWKAISANLTFFSTAIEFEGGFTLEPLVRTGWKLDDFKAAWIPSYPDKLRLIRNAMVHAREKRMARVILPTAKNYQRLRMWIQPLQTTAMEVMMYWDTGMA